MTRWRTVPDWPKYEVSDTGRVRNRRRGTVRKPAISDGYAVVTFTRQGRKRRLRVHRLVAEAFIPNPHGKPQVNHRDGDRANNRVSNLEWCTASENHRHKFASGNVVPRRSFDLTLAKVRLVSSLLHDRDGRHADVARKAGVPLSFVKQASNGAWFRTGVARCVCKDELATLARMARAGGRYRGA